jgi:hypothetical protein
MFQKYRFSIRKTINIVNKLIQRMMNNDE